MDFPRKFYLRREEIAPDTAAQNAIRQGLWMQGVELVDFTDHTNIDTFEDLGPDVGVAGYISDVLLGLQHLGIEPPLLMDYPDELRTFAFLGRDIREMTLGEARKLQHVFIKPSKEHKLFTGFVWENKRDQRLQMAPIHDSVPVWACDVVNFVSEYRTFILHGQILDCRRYKGDWSKAPDRHVVESAVTAMAGVAPVAYCLDFGVDDNGRTLLVEANDGFAMGPYGLSPPHYACMIAARWRQLAS